MGGGTDISDGALVSQPREQFVHLRGGGLNKQHTVLAIALLEGCFVATYPPGLAQGLVNIEEDNGVLEGTVLQSGVNSCGGSHFGDGINNVKSKNRREKPARPGRG
jgi:hypothetical protein